MIEQLAPGRISRRDLLCLTLPALLGWKGQSGGAPAAAKETSVILVYCMGGASHLETYDLKPEGPEMMRSIFRPIATRVPGVQICEHLPRHAQVADRFTLIRSMTHKINIHNDGSILTLTGKEPSVPDPSSQATSEHPDLGMVASKLRGQSREGMPPYVTIPYVFHMTRPTYLGAGHLPLAIGDVSTPNYTPPHLRLRGVNARGLEDRRRLLEGLDRARREVDAGRGSLGEMREQAYRMLTSPAVSRAFDISREPARLRERYGRNQWGQACLMARRLAEAGSAVVSVIANQPEYGPRFTNWDDHPGNAMKPGHFGDYMKVRLPYFDQAVATLIEDIHERGLDRKILVVVTGEFGRTPRMRYGPPDRSLGRDHWPDAYSALVSGGGLKMGQIVGATNPRGEYPTSDPTSPQDLLATVYRHLGIDHRQDLHDHTGRAWPVLPRGNPIAKLT
jgi:hypothetical protein